MSTESRLWHYDPSNVLCYVGIVGFALPTAYLTYLLFKYRAYYFISFVIGGLSQVGGYGARISSSADKDVLGPYIAQSLMLLLPPIFYAATIYMVLKKIILAEGAEHYSLMKVKHMTKIFVTFDCISLFIQASGGGLQATGSDISKYGQWIVVAGLIVQFFAFGYYMVVAVVFQRRVRQASHNGRYNGRSLDIGGSLVNLRGLGPTERMLGALHFCSALIMIRSIYRLVEYIEGRDGWLATHEAPFYLLDTLPMFLVMVALAIVFPPRELAKVRKGEELVMQTRSSSPLFKPTV